MLERHVWRDFVAVTFSVAVLGIGVGSTLPLTALLLTARGFGPEVVGWMVTAVAVGGILGTLASPAAALRMGRRNVMLGCVALASLSVVALQFVDSLAAWAALRLLFGVAMAPMFVLGEAWINILPDDAVRGRVVAIYTTSFTLFQVLGPLLTDALWRAPDSAFLVCGALFLLGAPGIALARRDDHSHASQTAPDTNSVKDGQSSWLGILRKAPAIVAGAAVFAAFDNVILSFLPLFALDQGFTRGRALAAAAIVLAGDATLQFAAGWLADRHGRARIQLYCGAAMCILLPTLPFLSHVPIAWEACLYCLGGVAGSIYTLSMVASGEIFGGAALLRVSGLIALTWSISTSVVPAATGALMQLLGTPAIVLVLWLMTILFLAATGYERRNGRAIPGIALK